MVLFSLKTLARTAPFSRTLSTPMEKLVQVSEQEVRIDFYPNQKCRANVRLTSLCSTCPVAFKVQTSSPHKFLVKPPTGVIPPLSSATFQVILKPQPHLPPSFPRSPSDRFLIKTAEFSDSGSLTSFFKGAHDTRDLKLKVAFVGPVLLRHAVCVGDFEAVRNIIRRQRTILAELSPGEAESLLRVATELDEPERMINLLLEAGLRIEAGVRGGLVDDEVEEDLVKDGMEERRVAEASDRFASVLGLREAGPSKGEAPRMSEGRRRRRVTTDSDKLELGEQLLMAARIGDLRNVESLFLDGGDISYCDQYGLTALHAAAIKGHKEVVLMLVEFGLDLEARDGEGHAPLHLAVVGGNLETVEMLIQNGANVNAKSKSGATPLYMATAMGYDDIIEFLISRGG